jgi:hypothetical protein
MDAITKADFDFVLDHIHTADDWALSLVLITINTAEKSRLPVEDADALLTLRSAILAEMGRRCAEAYIAEHGEPT